MKIKLIRDSRIVHKAGETVDVSPAEAAFLLSVNSAVEIRAEADAQSQQKQTRKKTAKETR